MGRWPVAPWRERRIIVAMEIRKAAGALGAHVTGIDVTRAGDDEFEALRQALNEHSVLFLRDQRLDAVALRGFAARFGPVKDHPAYESVAGAPGVQILESTAERPSKIELWHSDMTFSAAPPMATVLFGDVIPAYGGDTLWASAAAAWDALSEPVRQLLEGVEAEHDFRHGFRESLAEPGGAERLAQAIAENPPVRHPVVLTHPETGRRAVYVNPLFTTRLCGFSRRESAALLEFLCRHVVTEEFTVRFSWSPGALVIWDNRVTQHKPVNDYFPQHRRLLRVTIAGDSPP